MGLRVTRVSQCLDRKLKIAGFEVIDLLAILFMVSILNFITGPLNQRLVTVWIPALMLSATVWIGKRGKPDGYLTHLAQFYLKPRQLSAFADPGESQRRFLRSITDLTNRGLS